jgi:hypothetical protein
VIAALLLAAATVPSALDAEQAFARDAQRIGQWSAFRKWAHRDAVMFTPQAVWARDFLKGKADPPKSVRWYATHSYVSCDGRTAVNTGPAFDPTGRPYGNFTTVWQRDKAGWRWVYDGGAPLTKPIGKAGKPQVQRAPCRPKAPGAPITPPPPLTPKQARATPQDNGDGQSADKTLGWDWRVDKSGRRHLRVYLWNGRRYAPVLTNDVPAE